jgi:hypothetical protein
MMPRGEAVKVPHLGFEIAHPNALLRDSGGEVPPGMPGLSQSATKD